MASLSLQRVRGHPQEQRRHSVALNEISMEARVTNVRLRFSAEMNLPQGRSWGMQEPAGAKSGIAQEWRLHGASGPHVSEPSLKRGGASTPGLRKRDGAVRQTASSPALLRLFSNDLIEVGKIDPDIPIKGRGNVRSREEWRHLEVSFRGGRSREGGRRAPGPSTIVLQEDPSHVNADAPGAR